MKESGRQRTTRGLPTTWLFSILHILILYYYHPSHQAVHPLNKVFLKSFRYDSSRGFKVFHANITSEAHLRLFSEHLKDKTSLSLLSAISLHLRRMKEVGPSCFRPTFSILKSYPDSFDFIGPNADDRNRLEYDSNSL